MTEKSNKRKRNSGDHPNQTVGNRNAIDANWKKFLSSSLIMDKKSEKSVENENKEHFTGTFRRGRKKKLKEQTSNNVQHNLKTVHINNKTSIKTSENNIENDAISNVNPDTIINNNSPSKNNNKNNITKFIAMDCEMVGIGHDGSDHMLARISLVNKFGDCIYDKFVKAREKVTDYRTDISGVRREDMLNGEDFTTVQKEVAEILKGRILVGHAVDHDLSVLFLSHPKRCIRDTSRYKPFRKITKGNTPSLKRLAKEILGIDIQHGEHSSIEDAKATMQLYCTVAKEWENLMSSKRKGKKIHS